MTSKKLLEEMGQPISFPKVALRNTTDLLARIAQPVSIPKSTKPPETRYRSSDYHVTRWTSIGKNGVIGVFSLILPCGIVIHDFFLHEKAGNMWVSNPSSIHFTNTGVGEWLSQKALQGVTAFLTADNRPWVTDELEWATDELT